MFECLLRMVVAITEAWVGGGGGEESAGTEAAVVGVAWVTGVTGATGAGGLLYRSTANRREACTTTMPTRISLVEWLSEVQGGHAS